MTAKSKGTERSHTLLKSSVDLYCVFEWDGYSGKIYVYFQLSSQELSFEVSNWNLGNLETFAGQSS